MPRPLRLASGGLVFHVLNRAVGGAALFADRGDYEAFLRILTRTKGRIPIRLLAYCLMPTHWHFLLWPNGQGELSKFMHLLTLTHVQRWHVAHGTVGTGALYQGRFKSFPVQDGAYYFTVLRYIERNAQRANLVRKAHDWPWSSAWHRARGTGHDLLDDGPEQLPEDWIPIVNEPQFQTELQAVRDSVKRGSPYGNDTWRNDVARRLGLLSTVRSRGRKPRAASLTDT